MPLRVVNASVVMMNRLEAEEALDAVQRIGIGTGSLKREIASQALANWEQRMHGLTRPPVTKPTAKDLRAIGIGVRRPPRRSSA